MASLVEINWSPSRRELRAFGVSMLTGFAVLALIALWRQHLVLASLLFSFGCVAGLLGVTGVRAARLVYLPWMAIAFVMGNVMSRVVVTLLYFAIITPIGLLMRLVGRDALQLKNRRPSMWTPLAPPGDSASYDHQF